MAVKLWLLGAAFAGAALGTGWVRRYALRRRMIDRPGARRSHLQPTPRGGGIAIVAAFAIGIGGLYGYGQIPASVFGVFCASGSLVVLVSVWDDHQPLPMALRLSLHAAAALWAVYWFDGLQPAGRDLEFANWPAVLVPLCQALALLWLINLYNFMDGIDGICAVETISIGLGFAVLTALVATLDVLGMLTAVIFGLQAPLALALVGSLIGFLPWNWHPARIFLGDVGSVPLGYLVGWLLVMLFAFGFIAAAFILPMYYVADATITLCRRLRRGERPWRAHREHFYQRATGAGLSHSRVSLGILLGNVVLIGCAAASLWWPWPAVAGAGIVTALMIGWMATRRPPGA